MNSITEVSSKVDSLVSKVKLVEDTLGAVVTKSDNISLNLSKLKTDVELKFKNHDGRLTQVEAQVQSVLQSTSQIDNSNDLIYADINRINLIFSGLADSASEMQETLTCDLERILSDIVSSNIRIDCAYRLGKYQNNRSRPIKIRFRTMSDRNLLWNNKKNLQKPFYLNEDLSPATRKVHSILRNKRKDLLQVNPSEVVQIDWKRLIVMTSSHIYTFQQGSFRMEPTHRMDTNSSQPSSSSGTFLADQAVRREFHRP